MPITFAMTEVECCNCHVRFGLTDKFYSQRRDDHESFWCPNGHKQYFTGKSEADKLRDELSRVKLAKERLEADQERDRLRCKRTKAYLKGRITKLKKTARRVKP